MGDALLRPLPSVFQRSCKSMMPFAIDDESAPDACVNTWLPSGGSVWELMDLLRDGTSLKSLVLGFAILLSQLLIPALCVPTPPTRYLSMNAECLANFFLLFLSVARLIKNPDRANGVYLKIRKAKQSRH